MDLNQISQYHGTESLCFDKEDFMKNDFNADTFVKVHKATHSESLEKLRDDLGIYLKILRSSMIDLINRDYADFVNLSSSLSGLDSLIDNLKTPLGQLKEEVLSVDHLITDSIESISKDLEKRHIINQEKSMLHKLSLISMRLDHLETLLDSSSSKDITNDEEQYSEDELVNRVASEVNQLNFLVSQCEGAAMLANFLPRVNSIRNFVEEGLDRALKEGIKGNKPLLVRTLRTYASLGTVVHAHQQVQFHIRENLEKIINEDALNSDPKGLRGLYEKTITSIREVTDPLQVALVEAKQERNFSFLESSVFVEVVDAVINRLSFVFNPANPTIFHQRFVVSLQFLYNFEELLSTYDKVGDFRKQHSYIKFMEQWNLPVYYQIRYQEIGLVVEASLSGEGRGLRESRDNSDFLLASTQAVFDGLLKTFEPNIFLFPLISKFWKLFLLTLTRHRTWIMDITKHLKSNSKVEATIIQRKCDPKSSSTDDLCVDNLKIDGKRVVSGLEAIVFIVSDMKVLSAKLDTFYNDYIHKYVFHLENEKTVAMKDNLRQQIDHLLSLKGPLLDVVIETLTFATSAPLRGVNDTPRLYRRTNKAVPDVHQPYVEISVKPISLFTETCDSRIDHQDLINIIENVFAATFLKYHSFTHEVLSSVHKMEESLKKLKRARERSSQQLSDSNKITDDDKIRMQIYLDVEFVRKKLDLFGVNVDLISSYGPLKDMVTKSKEGQFVP